MIVVIGLFFILLFLGMPVAFAIGISGAMFFITEGIPYTIAVQKVVASTQSFSLMAIPLFIFAGNLMNSTGITSRLIRLSNVLVGHMYGHVGQVSCVLSTMMGGISGSSNADAAMESRVLGPDMIRNGYSRGWGAAINGISSLITSTIPPSMGLIIYGSVGEVSIGRLFVAGIIPGIIMMFALMITVNITAKKRNYVPVRKERAKLSEIGKVLVECIWALIFPIFLIVGIRFGLMTPSEAGAFAVMYAIFVGVFIYRELTWNDFVLTLKASARDIGVVMLIVAISGIFGYGIVYDGLPQALASFLIGVTSNKIVMLILIILMLLIAGMFVETTVIALLMTPILLPVVKNLGVDPVHFGLIMMTTVNLGIMSPPVGIALYTVSDIMGCKPEETFKEGIPFYITIIIVILIITFIPKLTLFLPELIYS